jgi:NADH dehydrogenase
MNRADPGTTMPARPRVVIIGGGFGGLYCTRNLRRAAVDITVIDRRNFHLFQPLLYQVATASLSPGDIASPLRTILRGQKNARVWLGDVAAIDVEARRVTLKDGDSVEYDYLVVATGATHAYFGHPEWAERALGLKTVEDALEMRRRFLLAFENAERHDEPALRRQLTTFVIVGAGPTGVELAGAMAEIARMNFPDEFRDVDTRTSRVILLEGAARVLPGFDPVSSAKAERQLRDLGVEVRTNTLVTRIGPDCVWAGDDRIPARNVFWAAGVQASPLGTQLPAQLDRAGRVIVEPDCSLPGHPEVFVVGDLAHAVFGDSTVPGVAQGAMQMGRHVAHAISRDLAGHERQPFRYFDKGSLATIGRARAVAEIAGMTLSGTIAWLTWAFVHILYLIGFRNRVLVMMQWAAAYFTHRRGVRLITEPWRIGTDTVASTDRALDGTAKDGSDRDPGSAATPDDPSRDVPTPARQPAQSR